jgi:hypothetical protein
MSHHLYRSHLHVAQEWGKWWDPVHESIIQKINTEMERKYKIMDEKISRLTQTQTCNPKTDINFYPRVVNKTSIEFSDQEMELLNKGLKYNLGKKQKGWICDLTVEAETAITMLPPGEQDYVRHQAAKNLTKLYQQQGQRSTHTHKSERVGG